LREGSAVKDFMEPDRIVLGADDAQSAKTLRELYLTFQTDFLEVNTRTAEMIKYANNCLLATQISTSNEIANLAAALGGIDAYEVMRGVHLDRRWNPVSSEGGRINPGILSYLIPGCGFGGSCFPKDVQAFVTQGKQLGLSMNVLDGVLKTNRDQPLQVVELLSKGLGILKGKRVAILGLAFKPGTDDIRESPAIPVIRRLLAEKVQVTASDPVANERAKEEFGGEPVAFYANWEDAVVNADAVVILTAWDEYASVSADELKGRMSGDLIIDARNVLGDSAIPDYFRVFKIGCRSFPLGQ